MRKLNFVRKPWFFVVFFVLGVVAIHIIPIVYAEPEENDKVSNETILVTQDYVDEKINKLTNDSQSKVVELEELVEAMKKQLDEVEKYGKFIALELEEGQTLLTGDSAEIILRGGKATTIAGEAGGLSDVTAGSGVDITTGQDVPLNHLLLVSRDDGRGLKVVSSKAWVLVKGPYTIEE